MKLVVLDRDGTINQDSPEGIRSPQEWAPIKGALEAIARLNHAGWRVLVASNQPGLASGQLDIETLCTIHDKMQSEVAEIGGRIDGVFFCPHAPDAGCECRKPKPGLLNDIARRLQTDMNAVPVIGDSLHDMQAAAAAGAEPMLVRTGNGRATETTLPHELSGIRVFDDLGAAATALVASGE